MSPRAQAAHGFLIKNDMSLWASCLADISKLVCYPTAELEAIDRKYDTPILQKIFLNVRRDQTSIVAKIHIGCYLSPMMLRISSA